MNPLDNPTLQELLEQSQNDRKKYTEGDNQLILNDNARINKLRELFKKGGIKTAQDLLIASLLFEYGQTIQDLEAGLICSSKAVELGLPPHKSLIPQATDKLMVTKQIRVGVHKSLAKQKYGTQISLWMDNGKSVSFCPLDGTVTEEELTTYGIPDCRKFEGKSYKDYQKAFEEAKKKAAQNWQATHH